VETTDTPDLEAVRVNVYVRGFACVFAGSVTFAEADPDVQGRVRGNPLTFGLALNLHVAASDALADRFTSPPEGGRYDGVALNAEMDGGGVGATVTSAGVACTDPPPLTWSLNV